MSEDNNDTYQVGFGKPPKHTQFRKGEPSANPSGRPKKGPNIRSELQEELGTRIVVQEGETSVEVSKLRAVLKALVKSALKGDRGAAKILLTLAASIPDDNLDNSNSPEEAEILQAYRQQQNSSPSET